MSPNCECSAGLRTWLVCWELHQTAHRSGSFRRCNSSHSLAYILHKRSLIVKRTVRKVKHLVQYSGQFINLILNVQEKMAVNNYDAVTYKLQQMWTLNRRLQVSRAFQLVGYQPSERGTSKYHRWQCCQFLVRSVPSLLSATLPVNTQTRQCKDGFHYRGECHRKSDNNVPGKQKRSLCFPVNCSWEY